MTLGKGTQIVLRAAWAFAGLILSAPAFLPPLVGVSTGLVLATAVSGSSFSHALVVLWELPRGAAFFSIAAIYGAYWICIAFLVVQFVLDKDLAAVPLSIVAIIMASTLVALQPWHDPGEPFMLGPWGFLHVAFMATVAWPSFRKSRAAR